MTVGKAIMAWMLIGNLVMLVLLIKLDTPQPSNGSAVAGAVFLQIMAVAWPAIVVGMLVKGVPPVPAPKPNACLI